MLWRKEHRFGLFHKEPLGHSSHDTHAQDSSFGDWTAELGAVLGMRSVNRYVDASYRDGHTANCAHDASRHSLTSCSG
jgi:hypothetical protein